MPVGIACVERSEPLGRAKPPRWRYHAVLSGLGLKSFMLQPPPVAAVGRFPIVFGS